MTTRLLIAINDLPFFCSHRLPIAREALRQGWRVGVLAPPHAECERRLRALGIAALPWNLSRSGRHPVAELASIAGMMRCLRHWRPDLLHLVTPKPVLYGSIAARLVGGGTRVVNAISGLGFLFTDGHRSGWLRRCMLGIHRRCGRRRGVAYIFQNPDDRAVFVDSGTIRSRQAVLVAGSGVETDRYTPGPAAHPPRICFAARMIHDKGAPVLVEAVRQLRAAGRSLELHLCGASDPGNPRAISESTLRQWNDEPGITWHGPVGDMVPQLQAASIFCLPTTYREGIPRALIEAASCGLPIVTTDRPGCREIVTHGHNGLLVPGGDSAALTAALAQLLDDPAAAVAMGRAGRERVLAGYAVERVVADHFACYQKLVDHG